jgi:hypothetical protein
VNDADGESKENSACADKLETLMRNRIGAIKNIYGLLEHEKNQGKSSHPEVQSTI